MNKKHSYTDLDLNLLRVFDAVYQTGSVTAAAAMVGLSQPAISHALSRLREELDDPLFIRSPQGMLPTARASQIYDSIHMALGLVDNCIATAGFDPSIEDRTFTIGMNDISEIVFLPKLMNHLKSYAPAIKIRTEHLASNEIENGLRSEQVDIAIGFFEPLTESLRTTVLFQEHYVCMVNAKHPAAQQSRLNKKSFLQSAHALVGTEGSGHVLAERLLAQIRPSGRIILRVPHFLTIPLIVAQNDLIVTVPSRLGAAISSRDIRLLPYPDKIPSFPVSLCWHNREENNPENRWFRELCIDLFREPDKSPRAHGRRRV
jgi:DNA-binding transcriptional LysR family regulator